MSQEMNDQRHNTFEYEGRTGQTRRRGVHHTCAACGRLFGAEILESINARSDPALIEDFKGGRLNHVHCPGCGADCVAGTPIIYHDPAAAHFCCILPEGWATLELETRSKLLLELAADGAEIPDYVRDAEVFVGLTGLERYLGGRAEAVAAYSNEQELRAELRVELERREEELVVREEDLQAKLEDLAAERDKISELRQELAQGWAELERERALVKGLAIDIQTREQEAKGEAAEAKDADEEPGGPADSTAAEERPLPAPESRPREEVDRWRAGEERTARLLYKDRVCLLARLTDEELALFAEESPELRVQMHKLTTAPVISLVIIPRAPTAEQRWSSAICWDLDPGAEEDQRFMVRLGQECILDLDLYDQESRAVRSWEISAPLSENVLFLMGHADEVLAGLPPEQRDFTAATAELEELGAERLGKKQHNFSEYSFQHLESPAATWLALGILSYWSEDENQEYLLFVKSFPLPHWRGIQERVVRRAMEFGLTLSSHLAEFALERKYVESGKELVRSAVANFSEVSLRIKANDLDSSQEWENWKRILADCVREEIGLEPEIQELAAASARRAGALENEAAPGGDLGLVDEGSLVKLLADNAQRRDAALELCDRGRPEYIEPLFAAVCGMTRAEVSRVMPAMIHLGPGVTPHFMTGLKHRKSFIRQGSALALGVVKAPEAAEPLIQMIFAEPTNLWREAARALGDFGEAAIAPIKVALEDADGVGRERLAWTLAQAALVPAALEAIKALGRTGNKIQARASARALELSAQVRQMDNEVRGAAPIKERTIIRSFSHCFFDALSFEVRELGEGDIIEQEEVLDDSDILEEEVEVQDDDIIGPQE